MARFRSGRHDLRRDGPQARDGQPDLAHDPEKLTDFSDKIMRKT
jgi:hypothetical protein